MAGNGGREMVVVYVGGLAAALTAIATILASTSGTTPAAFVVLGIALLVAVPVVIVLARRGVPAVVDRPIYLVFAALILGAAARLMDSSSGSPRWLNVFVLATSILGIALSEWKLSRRRAVVSSEA